MSVASHYDGSAASYADQYDPDKIWTNEEYPANYFRLELVKRLLAAAGSSSVYELGCGEATPLIRLAQTGLRVAGSDVSPEMVRIAHERLLTAGLDADLVAHIDAQDEDAMRTEQTRRGQFDAVIAMGVIPHVADDAAFVRAMDGFCRPGGQLLLQFRNSLFNMFTFNRLTKEFILDEILVEVPQSIKDVVAADLDTRLAVDKPPKRTRPTGDGYDEILARFHNPFELADIVRAQGYTDIRFHWYNFHPAYPMLAGQIDPRTYRQAQIDLEGDTSWRGMFMCSAGVIEATKSAG